MQHKFFQNSLQTFPADVSLEETIFFPTVLEKTKKKFHDNEKVNGSNRGDRRYINSYAGDKNLGFIYRDQIRSLMISRKYTHLLQEGILTRSDWWTHVLTQLLYFCKLSWIWIKKILNKLQILVETSTTLVWKWLMSLFAFSVLQRRMENSAMGRNVSFRLMATRLVTQHLKSRFQSVEPKYEG